MTCWNLLQIVASKALQSRTKNQVFYTQSYDRILEFQVLWYLKPAGVAKWTAHSPVDPAAWDRISLLPKI